MAIVSVSKLKPGDKLLDGVMTKRGNLLMEKGKLITEREKEILQFFFIRSVAIVDRQASVHEVGIQPAEERDSSVLPFYEEYHSMLVLLKQVFNYARTGHTLPILDIRVQMEKLFRQIDFYNILGVTSRNTNVMEYMLHNSALVGLTAYQIARWHGLPQRDWIQIALAGLFHDIGNVKVDPAIFEKQTRLTDSEMEEMRKHTVHGYQILKNLPAINEGVKLSALQHHEKEDGSGYPLGLTGDKVHLYAKVVAVSDIFHAMTSNRLHKPAMSPYLVLEQLQYESFGKLEPSLVQTFINRVTSLHNGTIVRLSDNRIGEIVFSDRSHPTRPWVNVNGSIVNLSVERGLFIEEVMQSMSG